jgi:hypothetical protein
MNALTDWGACRLPVPDARDERRVFASGVRVPSLGKLELQIFVSHVVRE